jgi:hypothetical protein
MILGKYFEVWTASSSKTAYVGHIPTEGADTRRILQSATHFLLRERANTYIFSYLLLFNQ